MCHERADSFSPGLFFYFFGIHFSNSGERAEARAYAVFASDLLLRDDPVAHLRPLSPSPVSRGSGSNDIGLILTRILSKFQGRNERRESKWELDSRNTHYGIFRATPKKRAK
jgi:hypothetical protein